MAAPATLAELRGATIAHWDAAGEDLDGADLTGATLSYCDLGGVRVRGVPARGAALRHVELARADLAGADLREALLWACTLERADLSGADLRGATITGCLLDGADLRGADLTGITLVGSSVAGVQLEGACGWALCRELVVELLRPVAGGDEERTMLLGALALERTWCYEEWAVRLARSPDVLRDVLRAFRAHPESGAAQALEEALPKR